MDAIPFQVSAHGGGYVQPGISDVTITHVLFDNGVPPHLRFMATPFEIATFGGDWLEENKRFDDDGHGRLYADSLD